jgi:hypothetical protein
MKPAVAAIPRKVAKVIADAASGRISDGHIQDSFSR